MSLSGEYRNLPNRRRAGLLRTQTHAIESHRYIYQQQDNSAEESFIGLCAFPIAGASVIPCSHPVLNTYINNYCWKLPLPACELPPDPSVSQKPKTHQPPTNLCLYWRSNRPPDPTQYSNTIDLNPKISCF